MTIWIYRGEKLITAHIDNCCQAATSSGRISYNGTKGGSREREEIWDKWFLGQRSSRRSPRRPLL